MVTLLILGVKNLDSVPYVSTVTQISVIQFKCICYYSSDTTGYLAILQSSCCNLALVKKIIQGNTNKTFN